MLRLPGAVLAGGQSRRMGRDKAFLDIDGKPMIRRSIEALQEFCSDVMIVGGSPKEGSGVRWHPDLVSDCGPLGGIYTALKLTRGDVVIAACDLPNVSGGLIRFLISHHEAHKAAITIPRSGEMLQPLLGIYGSSTLPIIGAFLEKGGRKVQQFLHECPALIVSLDSASPPFPSDILININTPKKYQLFTRG